MLKTVEKDKSIKYILISEFDRFSRNSGQAINILNDLTAIGVVVIACKTGQDTKDKNGFLMASISLSLAQWDNANRVDKFTSGRKDCLMKGIWVEPVPLGYYKEGKSKNTMCYLNEDGKFIRQAFLWKLEGYSNSEILDKLEARGLKLTKQTLHYILVNPFYAGKVRHKLTNYELIDGVHEIVATCCNLGSLWNDSNLETKIKVQHLVFPNGIFWNHENGCYRTPEKGLVFNIIDSVSGDYKRKTEADCSASVIECGR